jgi:hypothetical protein
LIVSVLIAGSDKSTFGARDWLCQSQQSTIPINAFLYRKNTCIAVFSELVTLFRSRVGGVLVCRQRSINQRDLARNTKQIAGKEDCANQAAQADHMACVIALFCS